MKRLLLTLLAVLIVAPVLDGKVVRQQNPVTEEMPAVEGVFPW